MNKVDVRHIIVAELVNVQVAIGYPVATIEGGTRPIGDLEKFDSQVAEDTTATILARLDAPADTKNPFTVREDGGYLTLDRIVDYFCRAAGFAKE